jgi:rare lipoprotein A
VGEATATGEPYDPEKLTAAHKTLPLGTELEVSHGDESVEVVINDRGPYIEGRDIDLSLAAAQEISLVEPGSAEVRVTEL